MERAFDKNELNSWRENDIIKREIDEELKQFLRKNPLIMNEELDKELARILNIENGFVANYLKQLMNDWIPWKAFSNKPNFTVSLF